MALIVEAWHWTRRLLLLKLAEFIACAAWGAAPLYLEPGKYYAATDLIGAVQGGLLFAALFFILTLYPLVSLIWLIVFLALGVRARGSLAGAASLLVLAYTAWWAVSTAPNGWPLSFWVVWFNYGLTVFILTWWLLPGKPRGPEQRHCPIWPRDRQRSRVDSAPAETHDDAHTRLRRPVRNPTSLVRSVRR